ncbi:MAG: DUF1841 family protein [Gammaproteobacteria bacterium]|nr:DUF1841 family protein [Gammaproteobacteria bacterium]MBU6508954.1 DUF1841 family protein [Gammaproteobacteria bacterium]MDE1983607.1 DUF1841 family protein [Gammaproteobacteria bacterium]MDE2107818.1 DUF1841 family protein [Gammaproteobacteria bacterium]MDE2459740.1 DUF1841 family protein [Gammaproteobacteria bacterium]
MFFEVWHKQQAHEPLSALETIVADIIRLHPEYQPLLAGDPGKALDRDWLPEGGETNPFLHMGLHIAIREQLSIDRPPGVKAAYQALLTRTHDPHAAEHLMLECLAETLWRGQRDGRLPDEAAYLACLKQHIEK